MENLAGLENLEGILMGLGIFIFVLVALFVICGWKIFVKAGQPGWACLVPIYGTIVLCDIVKKPRIWTLFMFIPYIGAIWSIWITNMLSKSFGKGVGFTLGLIFLPFIFLPILAFGSAQYQYTDDNSTGINDPNILDA